MRGAVSSRAFLGGELGDKDLWLSILNNKAPFTEAKGALEGPFLLQTGEEGK